jgi:hypothetical protein
MLKTKNPLFFEGIFLYKAFNFLLGFWFKISNGRLSFSKDDSCFL